MKRVFSVAARTHASISAPPDKLTIDCIAGHEIQAARDYVQLHLPGYTVISPHGVRMGAWLQSFEAVNADATLGAVIYVREQTYQGDSK